MFMYNSMENCEELYLGMFGPEVPFRRSMLAEASNRQILIRLLQNLKGIYSRAGNHHQTLSVIERILLLDPDAGRERRDRGLTLAAMGKYNQAIQDLEIYLKRSPLAGDAATIRERMAVIRQKLAGWN